MSQDTLLLVLTIFVSIAAIALVIQAGMLIGLYKSAKAIHERVSALTPKAESLMAKSESLMARAEKAIEESRANIADVTGRATEVLSLTHTQVRRVDELMADAHGRARVQMDRLELVLDDTMSKVQSTVNTVQTGVVRPIREITGVATGLRAAILHLIHAGRPSPAQATQDEEMFI